MPLDEGFRVVGTSLHNRGVCSIGFTDWNLNDNFHIGKHIIYVIKTEYSFISQIKHLYL